MRDVHVFDPTLVTSWIVRTRTISREQIKKFADSDHSKTLFVEGFEAEEFCFVEASSTRI